MNEYDSGTTVRATVSFEDINGNPVTPQNVFASVYADRPSAVIRPEAEITAGVAATMVIPITDVENTMVTSGPVELRRLRVRAISSTGDKLVVHGDYLLQRAT